MEDMVKPKNAADFKMIVAINQTAICPLLVQAVIADSSGIRAAVRSVLAEVGKSDDSSFVILVFF